MFRILSRAQRYCSMKCRFYRSVQVGTDSECWLWRGYCDRDGYGRVDPPNAVHGERRTHRIAFILAHGVIPAGALVMHVCDCPACCNPRHLRVGSPLDNMRDKISKGRMRPRSFTDEQRARHRAMFVGEKSTSVKLTTEAVVRIRAMYAQGGCSQRALAREFGVAQQSISRIVRRTRWSHLV